MAPGHVGAPSVDLQGKGQEEGDKTLLVELGFRSVGPVEVTWTPLPSVDSSQ